MEIKSYNIGSSVISYLINEKDKKVSMLIVPKEYEDKVVKLWDVPQSGFNPRAVYNHFWFQGSLVHFSVANCAGSELSFESQREVRENNRTEIVTEMTSKHGFRLIHKIIGYDKLRGLECRTVFVNESGKTVKLNSLSSFALDNLSPFHNDDASGSGVLHRYYGGWSREGKRVSQTMEELSLENSWAGFGFVGEKFGCKGSYPVDRYFPAAVYEDKVTGVSWGAQIAHNSTWQMELMRTGDTISFTGGLGDEEFCGWTREVKDNEAFEAPKAYISAAVGGAEEAMTYVVDMHKTIDKRYIEKGLPLAFNEYCTTWGKPTAEKMLSFCDGLKDFGVKYAVIDAGWRDCGDLKNIGEQSANGEWIVDKNKFPDIKDMCKKIRALGMVPGIWFEFEVTTKGSKLFDSEEYDFMHLKHDGHVIKKDNFRSYWDFRREDVREFLYERVIKFLRDNGFGYIKVDYNANIGNSIDGEESPSENLREHLAQVREFFIKMKDEIPDLVIENCASGGHRLEPSMLEVSSVSSFSDAHEAVEIPYIAANLHSLMLPRQSLIWATLRADETEQRTIYSLAATFLGRICLSGEVDKLTESQKVILKRAVDFYGKLENVIDNGDSKIYGNRSVCMRYPEGTQIVVRKTVDEVLAVCHAYNNPCDDFYIELDGSFKLKDGFYADNITVEGNKLKITKMKPLTACAVLLERND